MSIPKIIHYCWFGGNPLSPMALKCIESWKRYLPDFEIKQWDESNFDIHCCKYVEQAYHAKKWAFVADYARYYVVNQEGGVYFDTDTEAIKPFENLLDNRAFFGFSAGGITVPTFGAEKGHSVLKKLLQDYNSRCFIKEDGTYDTSTVNETTERILRKFYALVVNNQEQLLTDGVRVYPREYFFSTDWETGIITRNPQLYVIHYADGSWHTKEEKQALKIRKVCSRLLGRKLGLKIGRPLSIWIYSVHTYGLRKTIAKAYKYILK